jgi:hypothetical protein
LAIGLFEDSFLRSSRNHCSSVSRQGFDTLPADRQTLFSRLTIDLVLDGKELIDPANGLDRDRCSPQPRQLEQLAPEMARSGSAISDSGMSGLSA